ncbi:unnamed protein product [Bursaphelenchus xylophilus]|uniref:(pine wood nematode) hypothetical protein n=1 Tax=Bursaphelenchus xylophilus TaxID=6326 RepID=A0A1I7RXI2_BURXY|nr:unnamed protein product [Bursaphelenchus xylophilus]CAG9126447.1 unnamed protein product [Bursaphelenchus xylophilus]
MEKILLFFFAFLTVARAAEFKVGGKVKCPLDGATGHTSGTVQLWEHDIDPNDFMSQIHLKDNKFSGLNFSETEIFGEVEPYVLVLHDCHKELREEGKEPSKSGCLAVSRYYFSPPQGSNEIWLEFDLSSTVEKELRCGQSAKVLPAKEGGTTTKTETTIHRGVKGDAGSKSSESAEH